LTNSLKIALDMGEDTELYDISDYFTAQTVQDLRAKHGTQKGNAVGYRVILFGKTDLTRHGVREEDEANA